MICMANAMAHKNTMISPAPRRRDSVMQSRYMPTAAMTAAAQTTGATFFFRKIPNMGTKMIYSVVINPALPTLVYLIPNCCKVLAIVRKMPHKSPAFTFSFQSRGAALSPAIFLLIRIYTRMLAAPIRERTPLKVNGCI